ncbi:MAG: hypothetical protein JF607_17460 [Burkholderiales bacterium]|jgi:hypothetical protein|nr:hypothetical protein [Burkholderiales bacterium]
MPFEPGVSGNPNGRAKGSGRAQKLRERLGKHLPELFDRLMLLALSGDTTAAKLILDKVMPNLRPEALPVYLPDFDAGSPLMQSGQQIMRAVTEGRIPPDTGAQLLTGLASLAGLKAVDELEARIKALEEGDAAEFA